MTDDREQAERDAKLYGAGFLVDGFRIEPERVTVIKRNDLPHDNMSTTELWKRIEAVLRDKGASDDWLNYAMPDVHTAAAQFGFSCWGDGYLACERGEPMPNRQGDKA